MHESDTTSNGQSVEDELFRQIVISIFFPTNDYVLLFMVLSFRRFVIQPTSEILPNNINFLGYFFKRFDPYEILLENFFENSFTYSFKKVINKPFGNVCCGIFPRFS